MKYMLLIYEDEAIYGGPEKRGPVHEKVVAGHMGFIQEIGAARLDGAGLKGTALATTVRRSDGRQTIHDGPFAETKEQLGGFYLVDVPDLDAAIALARKMPLYGNGAVEIRPVLGVE